MPLMRAKFTRCGQPIPMHVDKMDYIFLKNHAGDFVANIDKPDHVEYLEQTGNFEKYVEPSYEELMERKKVEAKAKIAADNKKAGAK